MPMSARPPPVLSPAILLIALLIVSMLTLGCSGTDATQATEAMQATANRQAASAAAGFLRRYLQPDGRVIRPDQGGDTVSEGQAYGLLLAQAAGDRAAFARIWRWTQQHLQRPDGLFAFHADGNRVLDAQPASDADLLIAWALLRHHGPDAGTQHAAGRRVAAAILADEVTTTPDGLLVLAAGPWAVGRPASLNPSYWSLPAFRQLAALTGDPRWRSLAEDAVALVRRSTGGGQLLPPDWVALDAGGQLRAEPAPDGSQPQVRYGLDAQRAVVWLAADCDETSRALAATWWPILREGDRAQAQALQPDGTVLDGAPAPLPLVAAASAADAAGQPGERDRLLARAAAEQARHPTYYGGAWVALGWNLLTGRRC
jgi:endoglucanase